MKRSNTVLFWPHIPPGWSHNPSSWVHRAPLAAVTLVGFFIAAYLAFYQWGHIDQVWDPFFPTGSTIILNSGLSRLLPVPDAALGAIAYLIEFGLVISGNIDRWHRHPWLVLSFGVFALLMGAASVTLVMLQPLYFRAWCTLCVASALISIGLVAPALEESLASIQYLSTKRRWHPRGA